ncbi:MAG: hypothetical protein A2X04_15325 [Bacteroidetes bacterium GWF2_41_9]|nr:MAG: hypothetical protein A2X04_15325 [Bacteroidetes bacterium GWF2_41_9]HBH83700.1 hypothetical protein [Bacteroidales bacterium]
MELINVQNYIVPDEAKVVETSDNRFILANTEPISYGELKHKCIIPVFSKDNESTISHSEFIDCIGLATEKFFASEKIIHPAIRISHPIKGRIPDAAGKPADALLEEEKTIYYERMAFVYEVPGITSTINGNKLSLSIGGVRAYNSENLYGKKTEEHFKVFIGFKNHVCINLCISTDGFLDDLRVMSVQELFNRVFQLLTRFDAEKQINHLSTLSEYALNEHQFAQLVGKSRLYQYLPPKTKKALNTVVPISDSQISTVGRDYYESKSFCRSESGDIDMWKVYNLFTAATKSSYIDTFLDRNVGSLLFINSLVDHIRDRKQSWFLT